MPVSTISAKFKMSQNKPAGDRMHVIEHLSESSDLLAQDVAKFMQELGA
jgi:predicted FMN-binding regulatory protein PaiB